MKTFTNDSHSQSPNFSSPCSLPERLRDSLRFSGKVCAACPQRLCGAISGSLILNWRNWVFFFLLPPSFLCRVFACSCVPLLRATFWLCLALSRCRTSLAGVVPSGWFCFRSPCWAALRFRHHSPVWSIPASCMRFGDLHQGECLLLRSAFSTFAFARGFSAPRLLVCTCILFAVFIGVRARLRAFFALS